MKPVLSADDVEDLLPQTQCTRCGFQGCRPYAEAIVAGAAAINQCPPGGTATIQALARLLGVPVLPLNPDNGIEGPPLVAVIDEARCIGCARCLPPCPVDAIVGARRHMHTVLAEVCTGCELCVAPCPVDCISLVSRAAPADAAPRVTEAPPAAVNRARFAAHTQRIAQRAATRARLIAAGKQNARAAAPAP